MDVTTVKAARWKVLTRYEPAGLITLKCYSCYRTLMRNNTVDGGLIFTAADLTGMVRNHIVADHPEEVS